MKWEYKWIWAKNMWPDSLNIYGSQGWELCSVVRGAEETRGMHFFMKRPKEDKE